MAAKFEVVQSGSGYRWVLKSQGRTLASSEAYSRRSQAEKAVCDAVIIEQTTCHFETRLAWRVRFFTGRPLTDIGFPMTDPAFGVTRLRSHAVTPFRSSVIGRRSAAVQ